MSTQLTRRTVTAGLAALATARVSAPALAQTDYHGINLRFITVRSVHQDAIAHRLAELAAAWGINLEIRQTTADDLSKKVVLDFVAGAETWDLIYPGGVQAMVEWHGRGIVDDIAPLKARLADPELLAWDDFTPEARKAATFGDKLLALPAATSDQAVAWRRDLFGHSAEAAAFKTKYGYDLAPPQDYKQWRDIAEFFTRKKGETLAGKPLERDFYGTVFSDKAGIFIWHIYETLALAFGVTLYDPKTGKADLLSPQGLAAVQFLLSMVPFMPPGHIGMANPEAMAVFTSGDCAFIIEYFDRQLGTILRPDSAVSIDQVGFALPPTATGNPTGASHAARSGPVMICIASGSKHKDAAFKLLEAAVAPDSQVDMAHRFPGYMPNRISALKTLAQQQPQVRYLLDLASNTSITTGNDAVIIPLPGLLKSAEMTDAIGTALQSIMVGGSIETEMRRAETKVNRALASLKK